MQILKHPLVKKILGMVRELFEDYMESRKAKPERRKLSPRQELEQLYKIKGFKFNPDFGISLFQDWTETNVFNDVLVIHTKKEIYKWRVTGEGGDWSGYKKRYKWRSRFLPGFYTQIYKFGTFLNAPALKMFKNITLFNLETGKKQRGGGCHVHIRRSTREEVANASAGCIVPYRGNAIHDIITICRRSKKTVFSLAVFMKNEFPGAKKITEVTL